MVINNFFELCGLNTGRESKNIMSAPPKTTGIFGPSGSSKNQNIVLEQIIEVGPRIISEVLLDKSILNF